MWCYQEDYNINPVTGKGIQPKQRSNPLSAGNSRPALMRQAGKKNGKKVELL